MATYKLDEAGLREHLLNTDFMVELMRERAERAKAVAEATAPVGPVSDPHRGRYKESLTVDAGKYGGIHKDRAYGVVSSDAPEAVYVEFGTEHQEAQHILTKAMDAML